MNEQMHRRTDSYNT